VATREEVEMVRHPKTLIEFMQMYPTEEDCREALFEHRWPQGFACRRCGNEKAWHLRGRGLYECAGCPYWAEWFLIIWLLASTKKAPSAAELSRQLGVTVKTAWLMRRKIIHAMARREGELLLRRLVELDEGFVGGKRSGPENRGRRQPHKPLVTMAAGHTFGSAHLRVIADAGAASLRDAALATIVPGSVVQTDGWNGYADLEGAGYAHLPRETSTGADVDEWLPFSHIALSNFKRWTLDVFHGVSPGHLQAYLDEYCYRLNRRGQREDIFRRLLNRCLLHTGPAPYSLLTGT
jgi:hypothetical protein